jgi:branched-chain amino acid transport system substrate-binding protein/urea transport system substrate-binding protein
LLYATNYEGGMCNRYMFSFNTVPNQELDSLLPYMTQTFGGDFFLLGADRDWPHRMFDIAGPVIAKLGGKVVGKQYTLGAEKDFKPLMDQVAASKAKVLLYALKGDGMQFIPFAYNRGLFKNTTVAFLGLTEADLKAFGGKVDNIYAAVPFVVASDDPKAKAFVARARAKAGPDMAISNYVETHYNTLMAVKAALEKAGKVDKEALIDALEGLKFDSPGGPVTMGKDHHATLNMFLARTQGPELAEVRSLGEIAPQPGCKPDSFAR